MPYPPIPDDPRVRGESAALPRRGAPPSPPASRPLPGATMPMSTPSFLSKPLLTALLAGACAAAAHGAEVNPRLAAAAQSGGRAEALIVLAEQGTPAMAALPAGADYKAHRRALVEALRQRGETQQAGL